jgi:hypothetical protein
MGPERHGSPHRRRREPREHRGFIRPGVRRGAIAVGLGAATLAWPRVMGGAILVLSKDTPLWDPHDQLIYMWTSEQSADRVWYMNYQAFVSRQPKGLGNPRHGYRCVKDAGR